MIIYTPSFKPKDQLDTKYSLYNISTLLAGSSYISIDWIQKGQKFWLYMSNSISNKVGLLADMHERI